jgi:hypothetical protein
MPTLVRFRVKVKRSSSVVQERNPISKKQRTTQPPAPSIYIKGELEEEYQPESDVVKAGPSSTNKKAKKGILKNIDPDVYSTPIFESRTRKGIIKGSTSSIDSTASTRGQEEKKSFIKKINTLQAIVDGKKAISVTVLSPSKASIAPVTVARKPVAGDHLETKGKYRKLITNEWIENQFVLLIKSIVFWYSWEGQEIYLLLERVGWALFLMIQVMRTMHINFYLL